MLQQRIQIDIDLAGGSDETDFKAVGLEAVFHQSDLFHADHILYPVGNDEACRRRPDVADVTR